MRFDHAGVATDDAAALAATFGELLDATVAHEEEFGDLSVTFLDLGNGYFELLEPLPDAEGPVPDYLDREGPGIHHLALATDDVEAALSRARAAGVDLVDESPRPGAWGHDVAFLHPASTGGVLIEFVEH
ncbi:methylmalonyl-CoA epimerase [Halomicrobium urmianum]|uniref:methylmalonyl-CoA epimerase n=1 Tax=Halomicrobium urmianum TaxID=1586233 RepID=UPI001CDA1D15|nr:methylmalonyl-CoA epimerase [Halomicrobium urmianum]